MKNLLLIPLILLFIPLSLAANILHVALDGSLDFSSIQAAVDAAAAQDTILIHPGIYHENVWIENIDLTIGSLELCTSDSSYISQTVINGNQNGSCIGIWYAAVSIRGLSLTNGSGTTSSIVYGGGIFAMYSNIAITNCQVFRNWADVASGVYLSECSAYMAGTDIYDNWASGPGTGGFIFSSYADYSEDNHRELRFDPDNRCSIYNNIGTTGNDIWIACFSLTHIDIYLDKFTIAQTSSYFKECVFIHNRYRDQELTYNIYYHETVLQQQLTDLYVSPDGDDNNSGLSSDQPLKTIALALHRIGAEVHHPGTIHLANGRYAEDQHFPLNPRSYVSIVGESEAGVIVDTGDAVVFIWGTGAEKDFVLKNITFTGQIMPRFAKSEIITFNNIDDNFLNYEELDKPSITLENITFRDIVALCYEDIYELNLVLIYHPEQLVLKNITVDNCMFTCALNLFGGNVFADGISVRNTRPGPYLLLNGMALSTDSLHPLRAGGDYIFQNMEITDCHVMKQHSLMFHYGGVYLGPQFGVNNLHTYFINCTFAGNRWLSGPNGANICVQSDAKTISFINCIFSDDQGTNIILTNSSLPQDPPAEAKVQFLNCLLGPADNPEDAIHSPTGSVIEVEWYGTNLSLNPGFHAWDDDNAYALGMNSPCIDAGTTDLSILGIPDFYELPVYDLAGNPRVYGDQIDLGAYEWQGQTGIFEPMIPIVSTRLDSNYPNPFNPSTTIRYSLKEAGPVSINIYNIKGQLVCTLVQDIKEAGNHTVTWNGLDKNNSYVSSGIYFYKMNAGNYSSTKKMIMMK